MVVDGKVMVVPAVIDIDEPDKSSWLAQVAEAEDSPLYGLFGRGESFAAARKALAHNIWLQLQVTGEAAFLEGVRILATTRKTFDAATLVGE